MVRFAALLVLVLLGAVSAQAQLSPGELQQSHAFLEGMQNCRKCHGGNQELVPENCLQCHGVIRQQRENHAGLHSRPEYQRCQTCHVEHQGRDFALIHWDGGEAKFNHALTTFPLEGAHSGLDCRKCHVPLFISGLNISPGEKIDSAKTFLGLQKNCTNCHRDEHRGQLDENCLKCHTQSAWKPAAGFDHAGTSFPLTGKHQSVDCAKCHAVMTDQPLGSDPDYVRFAGVKHEECSACHTDPHQGSLGAACASCHSTVDWHQVNSVKFDHSKTRFPLFGKHQAVACASCHAAGAAKRGLKFAACLDCHRDVHHGEFAARASKGACEECHTVDGFSPAKFLLAQHAESKFPLLGAHQAVPCMACHSRKLAGGDSQMLFAFSSTRCLVCHKDPHGGQVDKIVKADGCEHCHVVDDWSRVQFDHNQTKFPLIGKHAAVACSKCHGSSAKSGNGGEVVNVRFSSVEQRCESCHQDIHRGQFADDSRLTDCARCHSATGWKPSLFDHRTSRYILDGAHKSVACVKCHLPTKDSQGTFIRYKPMEFACVSCHGDNVPKENLK